VLPGGCSGKTYDFSFDSNGKQSNDTVLEKDGLTVLVDNKSLGILNESRVDYVESLHGAGFVVKNPQASGGCGCGKSFN
jgi:iron-sulfur cluster insertion protein